ncbi:MAG: hypothetical protein M3Y58_19125 [Chloroflexota bacterium]|nr:hypothetical protein [Chloroflexota bacterium]
MDNPYPADTLIHDLIAHPRAATEQEIRLITERIASAPFSTEMQDVPVRDRGRSYLGITLGLHADSLTLHLVRRVIGYEQWAIGTTADAYVGSLRQAVRDPNARLALYQQWGMRDTAVAIAPTRRVLETEQLGSDAEANIIVVYNATRGILISGYQFSAMDTIHIPGDALWLR